jgi:hypothetical protein
VQPARAPEIKQLQPWIARLDSDNFKEREAAYQQLLQRGGRALPALRAALKQSASLEQRRRLELLIAHLEDPRTAPPHLRELRALEVLERIGGTEARRLVERVAAGYADDLLTREARRVLERWPASTAGP